MNTYQQLLFNLKSSNYAKGRYLEKELLKADTVYIGYCRNASEALWDGTKFTYMRNKFSHKFPETIYHPDDETAFDVFYPFYETTVND